MKVLISILLAFSFSCFSQTASKEDINKVLDYMGKQGLFKPEDIEAAKADMMNMNQQDWNELNQVAKKITVKNKNIADFKKQVEKGNMPMPTQQQLQKLKEEMKVYQEASMNSELQK